MWKCLRTIVVISTVSWVTGSASANDRAPAGAEALRERLPGELSGLFAFDSRQFFFAEKFPGQREQPDVASVVAQPEWYLEWNGGADSVVLVPFYRWNSGDTRRTHFDLREANYLHAANHWEVRVGIGKVFWGVAESQHFVDIINQDDAVEDVDGEDKLGQPMIHPSLIREYGTFELFILPGFRLRTFSGQRGRLCPPFVVREDDPKFESSLEQAHVDVAGRWSHTLGDWDMALSHFYGTSRDPRFLPDRAGTEIRLVPAYDLIQQTGAEAQYTGSNVLLKLEGFGRGHQGPYRVAFIAGFEYTFYGVFGTAADVGVLGEFLYDSREDNVTTQSFNPFERDIFGGIRLALNDAQNTELLAGGIIDPVDGGQFWNIEASRRLWGSFTLEADARLFANFPADEFVSSFIDDDFFQVRLAWHF